MSNTFPFSAIVGQDEMKLAILVAAVDPSVGGVLIFGDRGTGKSTVVRALAALLPKMRVVQGCRYGCDPDKPFCKSSGLKNALCDAAKADKSALACATRSLKSCRRDDTVRHVATAGSKRRAMKAPMVGMLSSRCSRNSVMRVRTSSA